MTERCLPQMNCPHHRASKEADGTWRCWDCREPCDLRVQMDAIDRYMAERERR